MSDPQVAQAKARVANNHQLQEYRNILIDYDWDNYDEHIEWVATGDLNEIITWCQSIRADEQSQSQEERSS